MFECRWSWRPATHLFLAYGFYNIEGVCCKRRFRVELHTYIFTQVNVLWCWESEDIIHLPVCKHNTEHVLFMMFHLENNKGALNVSTSLVGNETIICGKINCIDRLLLCFVSRLCHPWRNWRLNHRWIMVLIQISKRIILITMWTKIAPTPLNPPPPWKLWKTQVGII